MAYAKQLFLNIHYCSNLGISLLAETNVDRIRVRVSTQHRSGGRC